MKFYSMRLILEKNSNIYSWTFTLNYNFFFLTENWFPRARELWQSIRQIMGDEVVPRDMLWACKRVVESVVANTHSTRHQPCITLTGQVQRSPHDMLLDFAAFHDKHIVQFPSNVCHAKRPFNFFCEVTKFMSTFVYL